MTKWDRFFITIGFLSAGIISTFNKVTIPFIFCATIWGLVILYFAFTMENKDK